MSSLPSFSNETLTAQGSDLPFVKKSWVQLRMTIMLFVAKHILTVKFSRLTQKAVILADAI